MLTTLAFTLGLVISYLGLPLLNQITHSSMQFEYFISPLNFSFFMLSQFCWAF